LIFIVLVLEIRTIWLARDEDEDEDEVLAL
jgi:hypothetical protein